jgi:two-component system, cell cycle sensor histidine kinase and response regulator CckA
VAFAGRQLRPPGGETIGVLALFSKTPIPPDQQALLTSVGNLVVLMIQALDVEMALRESEARFRSLIEGAPEAIFVQSDNVFRCVNQAMLRLVGAERPDGLLGKWFFDSIAPEFHDIVRERIRIQQELGTVAPPMAQEYVRFDGARVAVETTAVAFRFQGRDGHVVFVRDMTARRRTEADQQRLRDQLQQAMKMEGVGRLAGGVAHDFNILLTGITGNVRLALLELTAADPLAETLREIGKAAASAAALTRQLLAFSR